MKDPKPESLLPLPVAVFHILIALADRDRHGYSIMQDTSDRTAGTVRLSAGTLYSSIHRMLEQGLIEELRNSPDPASSDERRRYYRIAKFGRQVALAEAQRLSELLHQARATGLIPGKALSMLALALYRALLRCYPASFRQEYGSEMLAAFAAQVRDARQSGGWRAAAFVQLQTILDLLLTALQEQFHAIRLDLRYAIRSLASQPGFTAVAVLSLALGIGANTAIFSLLNSVLLKALPVRDPKSLVMLTNPESSGLGSGSQGGERSLLTYTEFRQIRDRTGVFSSLMACESELDRVQAAIGSRAPEELRFRMVSNEYFETLGVPAIVGRTLQPADELRSPYAVIGYEFWQRRFGGRAEAVGQTIAIHKAIFTIIGVMPASFFGETVGERPDLWLPLGMQPAILPGRDFLHDKPGDPSKDMWLHVFGRLKPGIAIQKAQAAVNLVFRQELQSFYAARLPADKVKGFMNQQLTLRPAATGASVLRTQAAGPLKLLLAASGLVLLIACANLGNLLLARLTARTREFAVRSALGASRRQLVRQVATESLVIAATGGIASLLAAWALRIVLLRLFSDTGSLSGSPDPAVLAFTFFVTLFAGVTIGLIPVLQTLRTDIMAGLREQGRGLTGSAAWLRAGRAIVAGQLALSLPLLVGAGLLLRTFYNLQRENIGFEKEHVLTFEVDALSAGYSAARQFSLLADLLGQVRSVPGVRAATYSNNGFFTGNDARDNVDVEGYIPKGQNDRRSRYEHVGPGFFSALGIPVRAGREITDRDTMSGPKVCVINRSFARAFFAGRNPLGLHVTQKFAGDRNTFEVVGVVEDSRQNNLRSEVDPRFYLPAAQPVFPLDSVVFEVRTLGDPLRVMAPVRKKILSVNSDLTIANVSPLTAIVDRRITQDRILGRLSVVFGIVGLLLAAIGLYGVLSYAVGRRTGEIGIRKALGAPGRQVMLMILRETSWLLAIGLSAGFALTFVTIRLIGSRLYGLAPTDPAALAGAIFLLTVVALFAAWVPAYRASRIDPLAALRYE